MPNSIKYSESSQTLALKKGNLWIGVGDVEKGPSVTTGYYNGVTPATGGYTIYLRRVGAPGEISYNSSSSDLDLISFTNSISGQTFATGASALDWYNSQTDKMVFNIDYPTITTNELSTNLDAGFTPSYPKGGTSWYDVSPNSYLGTLVNGPVYNSANSGSIFFDGTDDYVDLSPYTSQLVSLSSGTIEQWLKLDSSLSSCTSFFFGLDTNNRFEFVFGNRGSVVNEATGIIVVQGGVQTLVTFVIKSSSSFYFDNIWHQFVYTSGPTGNAFYVDGVAQTLAYSNGNSSTQKFFSDLPTSTITNIGRRILSGTPSQLMKGYNSITRIYGRSLSASEISQNFEEQRSRFGI